MDKNKMANVTAANDPDTQRQRTIYRVTLKGSIINVVLLVVKFVAGIVGGSAAMIADAVHSLSDFITDKPEDRDHDYGHG